MKTTVAVSALLAAGLAAALPSPPARADAVGPPPDSCPAGGLPASCHGGPYCAPDACELDEDCAAGSRCEERAFCIGTIGCAGMVEPGEDLSKYENDTLEGFCSAAGTCAEGSCETRKLCLRPSSSGGGCHGALPGAATAAGLMVAAALLATRRRRSA